MTPKVTVVITTLNRIDYLREAVESVRVQDEVTRELIVVDNGSSDDTPAWLDALTESGVTTIRVEPTARSRAGRVAEAREAGLRLARGEHVWFLDDDDRLRPGALALLASALERHPGAVVAIGARTRFGEGVTGGRVAHPLHAMIAGCRRELLLGWGFIPSQTLCRTEAVRRAGGWNAEVPCAEDLDMWARLLALGPAVIEPQTVIEYRVHRSQSRIADPVAGHDAVLRPYATVLAGGNRSRGGRLRRAGRLWESAVLAFDRDQPGIAFSATLRAVFLAPELATSPLLRPLSTRMVVRSALRLSGPTRRWVEDRAQRPPSAHARRGAGFLS